MLEINPQSKSVTVLNHQTGESYVESYDKLIISTGAKAIVPSIDGLEEAQNVFSLRNIPDMDQIKAFIAEKNIRTATIVGGSFIGLEMMENLVELGIQVQLIEIAPQVMPTIDIEMAQMIHSQINIHGVDLILNDGLKEFRQNGRELLLTSGKTLQTDMTILSIGVLPENRLAKVAGLELGYKGGHKG